MANPPPKLIEAPQPIDVAVLLDQLGLGVLRAPATVLKPGSFPVWRAVTTAGDFHVKAFSDADWEWRRASLAGVREVEQAAISRGVDMAEPVVWNVPVNGCIVTVHRWVESRALKHTHDVHDWLGRTLATLHTIPTPPSSPPDSLAVYHGLHPAESWAVWAEEAASKGRTWAAAARDALPHIFIASELVAEGVATGPVVGSHRDLLPHNILAVEGGGFVLIDWDLAGPAIPWLETNMAVMDIGRFVAAAAGEKTEFPDADAACRIFRGYLRAGGEALPVDRPSLASTFGMVLGRISYAMWLSLGHRNATEAERQDRGDYLDIALPRLQRRLAAVPRILDLLSEALVKARTDSA